jgi:divinyl protochlorophyllide a 8-vinyl-reductase
LIALARATAAPVPPARIGPNAITRVADALRREAGDAQAREVFAAARLAHYLRAPPGSMVDEDDVIRLHRALREALGLPSARRIARAAGAATGDYLLANRIPRPVQGALRVLPAGPAARVLLTAIRRHAWTFAGSGVFAARAGRPLQLSIAGNPLCRGAAATEPLCDYYAATFERLFSALVHPRATVSETACEACGVEACRFEIRW